MVIQHLNMIRNELKNCLSTCHNLSISFSPLIHNLSLSLSLYSSIFCLCLSTYLNLSFSLHLSITCLCLSTYLNLSFSLHLSIFCLCLSTYLNLSFSLHSSITCLCLSTYLNLSFSLHSSITCLCVQWNRKGYQKRQCKFFIHDIWSFSEPIDLLKEKLLALPETILKDKSAHFKYYYCPSPNWPVYCDRFLKRLQVVAPNFAAMNFNFDFILLP